MSSQLHTDNVTPTTSQLLEVLPPDDIVVRVARLLRVAFSKHNLRYDAIPFSYKEGPTPTAPLNTYSLSWDNGTVQVWWSSTKQEWVWSINLINATTFSRLTDFSKDKDAMRNLFRNLLAIHPHKDRS